MNYVISICNPKELDTLTDICRIMALPMNIVLHGRGTAVRSMLDILGIETNEKRVVMSMVRSDRTGVFLREQKRRLFVGVPGHGIAVAVPVKSIGGGKTVEYLNGGQPAEKQLPKLNYAYELIAAIANEGRTDMVMNAARAAGATGGTVLHGKGAMNGGEQAFYHVSIAREKEVILIVARAAQKTAIMRAILEQAGPGTEAAAIVFSLPVSEVAGFGIFEENEEAEKE